MTIQWALASDVETVEYDPAADEDNGLEPGEVGALAGEAGFYGLPHDLTALGERLVIGFSERPQPEMVVGELERGDGLLGEGEVGIELAGGLLVIDTPEGMAALGSWLLATYGGTTA